MTRIFLIEPHGDDALISCASILRSKASKDIVTFASRPSYGLRDHFENLGIIEYRDATDYHWDNRPASHHEVNRWHKDGRNTFDEYMNLLSHKEEFLTTIDEVSTTLEECLDRHEYDIIMVPLGVVHPYHCVVRSAIDLLILEDKLDVRKVVYYSEGPYNGKKYGRKLEEDAIKSLSMRGRTLEYVVRSIDEELQKSKEQIYRKVYPTETSLFRFSYDEVIKNHEVFVGLEVAIEKLKEVVK